MSSDEIPPDALKPRMCIILKWPDFDGYGFNLHAERSKPGQFIGKIDEDSPAEAAGLKEGDRIVEVNGVNISNENHKQVVERIKSVSNETILLVVDEESDDWFKERKIVLKGSLPYVLELKTPIPRANNKLSIDEPIIPPVEQELQEDRQSLSSQSNKSECVTESPSPRNETPTSNGGVTNGFIIERPESSTSVISVENSSASSMIGSYSPTPSVGSNDQNTLQNGNSRDSSVHSSIISNGSSHDPLNLNMSVQEMRDRLANRKKRTPNHEGLDARKKHEIIEAM